MLYNVIISQEVAGPNGIIALVNNAIKEGWIPQGGVGADDLNYFQAVIKEEGKD